jgi:hypothetical protein
MGTTHSIQILGNQMLLLDEQDNGCDTHVLTSLSAAERQLERWQQQYAFDYAAAIESVSQYFTERTTDRRIVDTVLERIAKTVLHIPTLRCRGSDGLDFHDVGVSALRLALRAAYEAGQNASK